MTMMIQDPVKLIMKDPGKKHYEPKPTSIFPSNKQKPFSLNTKLERYSSVNIDPKNLSSVHSPSSANIFREHLSMTNSLPPRTEEAAPTNATRAYVWALALKNEKLITRLITDDREIERVSLDLSNQRVVKNDCNRTRVNNFDEGLRDSLEKILTFYCKRENITYKQGLNEVAAPFINFRKSQVNISNIYNYLVLFIDRFLPTSFIDKDFLNLQCYFRTLELLIKYHDPNFHTFLNIHDLPSELYATPWFLTLFSSKMSLDMVYLLWDIFIVENDTCFKFFIALALLLENKNLIIGSDTSMIPQTIANLTIKDSIEMKQIYKRAVELRMKTPVSFLGKIRELDIYKKDMSEMEMKRRMERNVEYIESLQCVLVSPHEVINTIYNTEVLCSDPECVNYTKLIMTEGNNTDSKSRALSVDLAKRNRKSQRYQNSKESSTPYLEPTHMRRNSRKSKEFKFQCILCQSDYTGDNTSFLDMMPHLKEFVRYKRDLKAEKEDAPLLDYMIIDLRQNKRGGMLLKSKNVDVNAGLEEAINYFINEYIESQSQYHFVLMISSFDSWAFQDSMENRNLKSKKSVRDSIKSDRSSFKGINGSSEEEWMFEFLNAFVQNGFSNVSIIEGGYHDVSKLVHGLNLEIVNHHPDYCSVCRGNGVNKSPSFFNIINKVIDKTGEKLGMLVDGINNNNNNSYADLSKSRDGRNSAMSRTETTDHHLFKTSPGFFNIKQEAENKYLNNINRDRESKPRSLNSVAQISESTQETGDYYQTNSIFNSEMGGSGPSIGSIGSGLTKYLQGGNFNGNDDNILTSSKSTRAGDQEDRQSGRMTAGSGSSKLLLSNSPQKSSNGNQYNYNQPRVIQNSSTQSSYSKSNNSFYGGGTETTKIPITGNKPLSFHQLNLGAYSSPKLGHTELQRYNSDYDTTPNMHNNSFIPSSGKIDTFNASRYVFDGTKKRPEDGEKRSESSDESRSKRVSSSQEKKTATPTGHLNNKAKSNDKVISYNNNYAPPSLAKMFKLAKQSEEDQRAKFYSTEFSMSKPFDLDKNNKTSYRDRQDRSFKDIKETSLADSFHIEPLNESRSRPGSGYLSSSKAFLDSYAKQINPHMANSLSKKGTITQILKETTTSMGQRPESADMNIGSGYQNFMKSPTAGTGYSMMPPSERSERNAGDSARRGLGSQDGNIFLDNLETRNLTSPRDIHSLRTLTQSPNPERMELGKMSDRMNLTKKKDMTIDTTLIYPNYTELTSPMQMDILKNVTSRMEDGKASSRSMVIGSNSGHFEKNGIFREVRLSQNGIFWLYKTFENVEFTFYACDYVKDAAKDDPTTQTSIAVASSDSSSVSKRVIIISKEFLVALQYSQDVIEDLRLLQVGVSVERILKRAREKTYNKNYQSINEVSNLLSPKDFGKGTETLSKTHDVIIEALFPVKLLLRITSKKVDAKYLSFYFKLPTTDKIISMNASKYFNYTEAGVQELPYLMKKEEYIKLLREISDIKDPAVLLQSKSVYCFESSTDAQECIQKTRDAYSSASAYINEKLRRNIKS